MDLTFLRNKMQHIQLAKNYVYIASNTDNERESKTITVHTEHPGVEARYSKDAEHPSPLSFLIDSLLKH